MKVTEVRNLWSWSAFRPRSMGHGATQQTVLEALAPQCRSTCALHGKRQYGSLLTVSRARPRLLDLTTVKQPGRGREGGLAKVSPSQAGTWGGPTSLCVSIKQPEGRATQLPGAPGLPLSLEGKAQIPRANLRKKPRFPDPDLQGGWEPD